MSTWRVVVRALHQIGGSGTNAEIRAVMTGLMAYDQHVVGKGLVNAEGVGLVTKQRPADGSKRGTVWTITPMGVRYVEGRVMQTRNRPGSKRGWVATWLEALPRGIRLADAEG